MLKKTAFTVIMAYLTISSIAQVIPNGNFESWINSGGYLEPESWGTLNSITAPSGIFTATRGGTSSNYYLKLTTRNIPGLGVIPGIATSGTLNTNSLVAVSGFPVSSMPYAFAGKWQYMGNSSNDIGSIKLYLTKWNTITNQRDTIGFLVKELTGMIMSWKDFSFPITYISTELPDTCFIILNASGQNPEAGSYLYLDDLHFSGDVAGFESISRGKQERIIFEPYTGYLILHSKYVRNIEVLNISGQLLVSEKFYCLTSHVLNLNFLPKGIYIIKAYLENEVISQKVIKL